MFGWKTNTAPIARRVVARSEIVHVQVALVQKRATTAHFRMGIGNVLHQESQSIHELGKSSCCSRCSPQRGHWYLRLLRRKRDSWDAQSRRASVGRGRIAICISDCRVDTRQHVSPLRATRRIRETIEWRTVSSEKQSRTWSSAAVSLKTLRHVVHSG